MVEGAAGQSLSAARGRTLSRSGERLLDRFELFELTSYLRLKRGNLTLQRRDFRACVRGSRIAASEDRPLLRGEVRLRAEVPKADLRGHVWVDLASYGIYVRVDSEGAQGPDGTVDAEFFLMTEQVDRTVTPLEVLNGRVLSMSHTVTILDEAGKPICRLVVPQDFMAVESEVSNGGDRLARALPAGRAPVYAGFGLRYAPIAVTRTKPTMTNAIAMVMERRLTVLTSSCAPR